MKNKYIAWLLMISNVFLSSNAIAQPNKLEDMIITKDKNGSVCIENKNLDAANNGEAIKDMNNIELFGIKGQGIYISIEKSRQSGETDLMDATLRDSNEDVWLFYEENNKGRWVDCGFYERNMKVAIYLYFLEQVKKDSSLSFYHTHLLKSNKKVFDKVYSKLSKDYDKLENDDKKILKKDELIFYTINKKYSAIINTPPSYQDFVLHKVLREYLKDKDIKIDYSRVAAPEGIFLYSCENKSKEEIKKDYMEFVNNVRQEKFCPNKSFEYKKGSIEIIFIKDKEISMEDFYNSFK